MSEYKNPLTGQDLTKKNIASCLFDMAGQENHDGDPWDQMQYAYKAIKGLKADIHWLKLELAVIYDNASPMDTDELGDAEARLKTVREVCEFVLGNDIHDKMDAMWDAANYHPNDTAGKLRTLFYGDK